ncbi:MAG: Gfo/Idh/MocA family oxidoreductase [Paenibacillaceae bacterium]|nr:Gfo/Idh/MocA family oxidoreductase [Paenibacillaceae bacterium]
MVQVAFVGAGGIAQTHFKALAGHPDARMVAVCDVVAENAERAALACGMKAYSDVTQMLDAERIDALFLCVPPFAHERLEETAAERGIHLLVEKPVGLRMEQARQKAAAIRQAGIIAATGYCLRYHDVVDKAKEYLAGKPVGMIRAHHLTGFVQTPWWREKAKSGGQLVEQATHIVDMTRYLCGDVNAVYGLMHYGLLDHQPGADIPSLVSVGLEYASGAIGHIDAACIQPDWRSGIEVLGRDFRLTLSGKTLTLTERNHTVIHEGQTASVFKEQDDAFIEAVRTGDPGKLRSTYDDALRTLEVSLAAYESAETGKKIELAGSRG